MLKADLLVPATGIGIVGAIFLGLAGAGVVMGVLSKNIWQEADEFGRAGWIFLAQSIFPFVVGFVLFLSARGMRRLRGYGISVTGCIVSLFTVVGTPFGIWGLIILARREVREAFGSNANAESAAAVDGVQSSSIPQSPHSRGILRRWWWVFLIMFPVGLLLGLAAGSALAHVMPKKYEAEAIIEAVPAEGPVVSGDFFGSQFEAITSRAALTAVSQELKLSNKWQTDGERAVNILKALITVENIRGTDLICVRVRHTNGKDAAAIANAVALNYQRSFSGKAIIHEKAVELTVPVSPNVAQVHFASGLLGLILSPLLALVSIMLLRKKFPEPRPAITPLPVGDNSSRLNTHVDSFAVTSFVLGLASLIVGPLGSLPAIIFGHVALSRIKSNPLTTGRGYALAGLVLGYTTLILIVIFIVILFNLRPVSSHAAFLKMENHPYSVISDRRNC